MKCLLVTAHPLPDSLCAHLAGIAAEALAGAGQERDAVPVSGGKASAGGGRGLRRQDRPPSGRLAPKRPRLAALPTPSSTVPVDDFDLRICSERPACPGDAASNLAAGAFGLEAPA